ncbi:hypothetical protein QUB47_08725 [Microcoleus sp. AT9_B5]
MKAAKLEIGVGSQEPGGKSQKEGARRSVFTNMRCSLAIDPISQGCDAETGFFTKIYSK